jgi:hypothetical protein
MSGGSWDYVFYKFEDVAGKLKKEKIKIRRELGSLVHLVANALHDIEWVDSSDYSDGDDTKAIEKCLNFKRRIK